MALIEARWIGSRSTGSSWVRTGCLGLGVIVAVLAIVGAILVFVAWQREKSSVPEIEVVEAGGCIVVVDP